MRLTTGGALLAAVLLGGAVYAQDVGWPPAPVERTGQVSCYDPTGSTNHSISCAGTDQDGDLLPGLGWPNPRFTDNGYGTVTDELTGLVWLKDANCTQFFGGDTIGTNARNWDNALRDVSALAQGHCGLLDGSDPGDWRLPSIKEMQSLVDYEYSYPALSDAAGTAQWSEGDAFFGVQSSDYWSSTTNNDSRTQAWFVSFTDGATSSDYKPGSAHVWPVRAGAPVFADGFGPGDTQRWSGALP